MPSTPRAVSRDKTDRDERYGLVRRFSERVGEEYPQNTLAQALTCSEEYKHVCENSRQREGSVQALLTSSEPGASESAIKLLDAEMAQMKDAWENLIRTISSGADRSLLDREHVDFTTVREAIDIWGHRYEKTQDMEFSSAKGHFHRFCDSMDSYSGLFKLVPDDDKYFKLFCGVLTTIVQASVNRGKIANGFASALADIGTEMTYWRDQLAAFSTKGSAASSDGLVKIVVQLFTKIFRFLVPYMKWTQSKWERFGGSLNKNYYEHNIRGPLEEVKKFSEYLKREADVQNAKRLAHMEELAKQGVTQGKENSERLKNLEMMVAKKQTTDRVSKISDNELHSLLQWVASMVRTGDRGQGMLIANSEEATYRQRNEVLSKSPQKHFDRRTSFEVAEADQQMMAFHELTFTEIEKRSQILGTTTTDFIGETLQSPQKTSSNAHLALQEWLSASESRVLWIYGPPNTSKPSDLSLTSAFVVSTITHAKLPLVAHQCQSSESEMGSLISLVYSVVIQLIWLLPEDFSTDKDFGSELFNSLDRSRESLPQALCLMEDLFTLAPRLLIVVIDGIQMCEDGLDNERGTGMCLSFFREILKNGGNDRVLKTLFTTDGVCDNFWLKLSPQEQVDVRSETGGTPEHRRKGRVAMVDLVTIRD